MQNAKFKMHNKGIPFGDDIFVHAVRHTTILHSAFYILHFNDSRQGSVE